MKDLTDKPSQYVVSYAEALRLDKMPIKRPEKLQCRPGYVQRGAVCQKIGNIKAQKPTAVRSKRAGGSLAKLAVGAIAAGVAGAAAIKATQGKKKPEATPELIQQKIQQATNEYRRTPTWQKAALVGAIAVGTPPTTYMAARARYRAGFKESAKIAEEKAKTIEAKKIKDREHTIVFGVGGMAYEDESPQVRSGERIVTAAKLAFSQEKGKDFKLVPVDNSASNVPVGRKRGNKLDELIDVANIYYQRAKKGRSQAAVDLAAHVIAWSDANPDKQLVMMGHSMGGYDIHEAQEILRIARPDIEKRLKSFSFGSNYYGMTNKFGESYSIVNDKDPQVFISRDTKMFKNEEFKTLDNKAHNQGAYFSDSQIKEFVAEVIYKDADKYKKEPTQEQTKQSKKQKQPKPPSQRVDSCFVQRLQFR